MLRSAVIFLEQGTEAVAALLMWLGAGGLCGPAALVQTMVREAHGTFQNHCILFWPVQTSACSSQQQGIGLIQTCQATVGIERFNAHVRVTALGLAVRDGPWRFTTLVPGCSAQGRRSPMAQA